MSDWSHEEILNFLECYKEEPCIWDPSHDAYKNKKAVADAWNRISNALNKPVKELKNKKEILMVTFRKVLKKKQNCISSGTDMNVTWFAYQKMESFLLPVYTAKMGLQFEKQSIPSETEAAVEEILDEEILDEYEEMDNDEHMASPSSSSAAVPAPYTRSTDKTRRQTSTDSAEQQMATAFGKTNLRRQRQSKPPDSDDEECDLYAKLLAKKLRELSKDERKLVMYEIDGLFIKKIKQRTSRETPSFKYLPSSRPSRRDKRMSYSDYYSTNDISKEKGRLYVKTDPLMESDDDANSD